MPQLFFDVGDGLDHFTDEVQLRLGRHRRDGQRPLELDVPDDVDRRKTSQDLLAFRRKLLVRLLEKTTMCLEVKYLQSIDVIRSKVKTLPNPNSSFLENVPVSLFVN